MHCTAGLAKIRKDPPSARFDGLGLTAYKYVSKKPKKSERAAGVISVATGILSMRGRYDRDESKTAVVLRYDRETTTHLNPYYIHD
jgi:hypothetical protein